MRPRSIEGLIILLRQAFVELVPYHEGSPYSGRAIKVGTYRAILTAIQTLESWRSADAENSTPAKSEAQ